MRNSLALLTLAGLSLHAVQARAAECITTSPPGAIPSAQLVVVASDATAKATFCGGTAGFSSDAFVVQDTGNVYIGTGNVTPSGSVVDLGAFNAGEELVFYIYVRNTGETFYSGPGSRNSDGIIHAAVTDLGAGVFHVGFEDLFGGGDLDYDDINLVIETTGIVVSDNDFDDDGIVDGEDNCIVTPNSDQADFDGDAVGDACDACVNDADNDADADGSCGDVDNCVSTANPNQADSDGDRIGDVCDPCPLAAGPDADGDGVCRNIDNCPDTSNQAQTDSDGDGLGDACDTCKNDPLNDADHDGICGNVDVCANTVWPESVPTRGLGVNRWALVDGDNVFDTVLPKGKGPGRSYSLADTAGCSCSQIIDEFALGEGHTKFGCSISAMDDWVSYVNAP